MQQKNQRFSARPQGDLHNYAGKYLVKEDTITIFCRQVDEVCPLKHVQIVEKWKNRLTAPKYLIKLN